MTIFYPDVSNWNAGVNLAGVPAVCIKATEGTSYVSPAYPAQVAEATQEGAWPFAYHFLHAGNAASQAGWCHSKAGMPPVMVDMEPVGSSWPTVADAAAFIDETRKLGGVTHLLYLPHWYWEQIGKPSLAPFTDRGMHLVSSSYTTYTDSPAGVGWQPYGGMTPAVWQYTDRQSLHGMPVDFNAFQGTLEEFKALVSGGVPPVPPPGGHAPAFPYPAADYLGQPRPDPHCHSGYYGGTDTANVHTWQAKMASRGWSLAQDGQYGLQSDQACRAFQAEKHLAVDGLVGPQTWAATWKAPVT